MAISEFWLRLKIHSVKNSSQKNSKTKGFPDLNGSQLQKNPKVHDKWTKKHKTSQWHLKSRRLLQKKQFFSFSVFPKANCLFPDIHKPIFLIANVAIQTIKNSLTNSSDVWALGGRENLWLIDCWKDFWRNLQSFWWLKCNLGFERVRPLI